MADLNTSPDAVYTWLNQLCEAVDAQVAARDLTLLTKLARNPGVKHYFDNVHKLRSVSEQVWAQYYPGMYADAREAYEAYQREEAYAGVAQRVNTLEGQLETLRQQLASLVEGQTSKKRVKPDETE